MAIAYDTSGFQTGDSVTSRAVSLAATGADRVAIIVVSWLSSSALSSLTVNGSATGVTQIGSTLEHPSNGNKKTAIFRLIAPPTSSVEYLASWGTTVGNAIIMVATYTGVHQTTPINGSLTTATGVTVSPSVTVSSATGEVVVATGHAWYPGGETSATADGGQNSRILQRNWLGNGDVGALSDKAGAASVTQTWTIGSSTDWNALGVRLAEAAGGGGVPRAAMYYYRH